MYFFTAWMQSHVFSDQNKYYCVFILGDLDTVAGLEKELSNAKEELELMTKKERESQVSFLVKANF